MPKPPKPDANQMAVLMAYKAAGLPLPPKVAKYAKYVEKPRKKAKKSK